MRPIILSPRLKSVADFVEQGARFVDIGTDHGFLPVYLWEQGRIITCIAADLRKLPLERAKETARKQGCFEKISFRLSDGLAAVEHHEIDTISIAGMGGDTIAQILEATPWLQKGGYRLILQSMTSQHDLRQWLMNHHYSIEKECLVLDGSTIYTTMLAVLGTGQPLTLAEQWAGVQRKELRAPLRRQLLAILIARTDKALVGLRQSKRADDAERCALLLETNRQLIAMEEEWNLWQQ